MSGYPLNDVQDLYGVQEAFYHRVVTSRGWLVPMSTAGVVRRRGPRRALSEEEILDAALGLLDDGGPDAASVRGIAARVGVAPNAIYTYFPTRLP